jgi:hypothetical protein
MMAQSHEKRKQQPCIGTNFLPGKTFFTSPYRVTLFNTRPAFSYSSGINYQGGLTKHTGLMFGMWYTKQIYNGFMPIPNSSYPEEVRTLEHFLEFPLLLTFQSDFKKLAFFGNAGVSISFLTAKRLRSSDTLSGFNYRLKTSEVKEEGDNTMFAYLFFAAGASYNFNETWKLSLTPTFRYSLTPLRSDGSKSFEHITGLNLSLWYTFPIVIREEEEEVQKKEQ